METTLGPPKRINYRFKQAEGFVSGAIAQRQNMHTPSSLSPFSHSSMQDLADVNQYIDC